MYYRTLDNKIKILNIWTKLYINRNKKSTEDLEEKVYISEDKTKTFKNPSGGR